MVERKVREGKRKRNRGWRAEDGPANGAARLGSHWTSRMCRVRNRGEGTGRKRDCLCPPCDLGVCVPEGDQCKEAEVHVTIGVKTPIRRKGLGRLAVSAKR
jgi:hypothetical protein